MPSRTRRRAAAWLFVLAGTPAAGQEPAASPSPAEEARPEAVPGSRASEWRALREKRLASVRPYKPGFFERQILAFEKAERPSLLDYNVAGFYPRLQSIASGSTIAAGLRLWHPDIRGSAFDVHGSVFFSRAGYEYYDLQFGRIPHDGKQFPLRSVRGDDVYELGNLPPNRRTGLILYGSLRYQHYSRLHFFGVGPEARESDESTFLDQKAFYEVVGGSQLSRHFALLGRAGYMQAFVGRGEDPREPTTQDLFSEASAPGLTVQPDFFFVTGQAFFDHRDRPANPHKGAMLALQATRFADRGGDAFGFTRLSADARGYVPLGSVQRTLALRAYFSSDDPERGARVPFYLQETLGGSHTLRGFESFRFRDARLLLLQAEYRWEASPAIELALFADAGRVAERTGDLFQDLETDWGVGFRLKSPLRGTFFRFDVAKGREGTRLLARVSPAF